MKARCAKCGAEFGESVLFCGRCGTRIDRAALGAAPERADAGESRDVDFDAAENEPDPILGRIVDGRYRVLKKLGEGGMGAVYQVEHVHMGKYMAMKLLLRELSGNREIVRRFRREAQAISRLTHPHTVQVFDFGRTPEGAMYMVMEYLHGETLAELVTRDGPLPPRRVARIVSQICSSLAEAHTLGIIHRDLKPENVMMVRAREERDYVKVLDFGLAKLRDRERERDPGGATSHHSLVGTPYYMAPEQIRGGEIDARTDVYALGAMTYKILTGEPPFRAPSPIAVLTRHLNDPAPSLGAARPALEGAPLDDVLQRAMAKDPRDRYAGVDAFRDALEAAAAASPITPSGSMPRASSHSIPMPPTMISDELAAGRSEFEAFERRMRLRRFAWSVVAIALVGGVAASALYGYFEGGWFERATESEPNNQRAQANNIPLGKPIKGHIGKRLSDRVGDVDWFRVRPARGAPPSILRVELSPVPNIDLILEAWEEGGRVAAVAVSDTGVGGGEVIPNVRFDGPLYLRVAEAPGGAKVPSENSSDAYTLVAVARPALPNEEREPNDDLYLAQEMAVGSPIKGWHGKLGDADYFRFPRTGAKGEAFEIRWKGVPGVEAELHVITAETQLLDAVPGRVVLPGGDRSFYVTVLARKGSDASRPYSLEVIPASRAKPAPAPDKASAPPLPPEDEPEE